VSSAISLSGAALAAAHEQFLGALPVMENVIRFQLRGLPKRCRAERINDALAACWHAWSGLVRRGKDPVEVGVSGIAANACRYVRGGRCLGTGTVGRGAADVHSPRAQKKHGFGVVSLDQDDETSPGSAWREWLAQDRRTSPGDAAAFAIDFDRWLAELPERKRAMAALLAEGNATSEVADQLGVTAPAVSIARAWLSSDWARFQGEAVPDEAPTAHRPVGRPRKVGPRAQHRSGQRAQHRSGQRALVPLAAAEA
jgi:hypothetical protein